MTNADFEARLQLITKAAPDLRAAGVMTVTVGDIEFALAPHDPPQPTARGPKIDDDVDEKLSMLADPVTFGGVVPRRRGADRGNEVER